MNEYDPKAAMLGPTLADASGKDFIDGRGRRWLAVGKVTPKDIDVAQTEQARSSADYRTPPEPDPRGLSVRALAEKLRPRRLVGDYEYLLEEPDYEVAERILAMEEAPATDAFETPDQPPEARFVVPPTDDRVRINATQFSPASHNAYLSQTCTATMIGPSTALCAAHCFYQGGWITSRSITFGANTTEPKAPFGSFLADSLTLPGAWNINEWDWDFAVLEFSPSRPNLGRQTGWFGTAQNFNGRHTIIGYPVDKPVPSSWTASGTFTASPGSRYEHDIDIVSGDSGAGAYHVDDGRVAGIQSTQWTNPTRTWNEVRRWDSVTYNFFHAYGNWPRS